MNPADFSEHTLVEMPAVALFRDLGYATVSGFNETFGPHGTLGRETTGDVVLVPRLRAALQKLNPKLPASAIDAAIEQLTKDRSAQSLAHANRDVYKLLKDGVRVTFQDDDGGEATEAVAVIDWRNPEANDFLLVSQFWVTGSVYKRRADLVGFVNGLPLLFLELKKTHAKLETAHKGNLKDYKSTIPQVFWYNAVLILSNGSESKVGTITSGWEHFFDWKRINDEGEAGVISLETALKGVCDRARFLDIVENFTVFDDAKGGLVKVVAKNHQYLGVNNALAKLRQIKQNQGKLGVFWHTQGSGKSFSMVFFSQKVLRTVPGNWTFLVLTDRDDLDNQIYKNFANTGVVAEKPEQCRATSGKHLQQLLKEDHRFVFTLIQKFVVERPKGAPKGQKQDAPYPMLSDRSDVIVMADEAHRSQYDILAQNMRNALPSAAFIAFTGTPLMAGEERTRKEFGDYVSIYNFRQSIEDGATVPLYYENRIPELQLANENFKDDLEAIIEEAELDEEQQAKLEREFAREYHLITRDDRLEKVAEDLVAHFVARREAGKGMVICIDKLTTVKMFDKVQKFWKAYLGGLRGELAVAPPENRADLEAQIKFMETTDMAVVVSDQQNEVEFFKERGLDILPHRTRMAKEDLETKFKTPDDPFRLVFVCAMWITGFDAPCVSTIYLDKPMKNHTLMQTIARANRVWGEKNNGLIVDYVGVFKDLKKALAIYGSAAGGGVADGDTPVQAKDAQVADLRKAITEARQFCTERGVDVDKILHAKGFDKVAAVDAAAGVLVDKQVKDAVDDAVEQVIVNDDLKRKFLVLARQVLRLYKAILPDTRSNEFIAIRACFSVLVEKVRGFTPGEVTIAHVMEKVNDLLDQSIATKGYVIHATEEPSVLDLSEIDFDKLREWFEKSRKRSAAEKVRQSVEQKLQKMMRENKSRAHLLEKFKKLIEEYNAGLDVDSLFQRLVDFVKELNEEDQRGVAEQLSAEELSVFDILTKPDPELKPAELAEVKKVARQLLITLKQAKLVLDWRKKQKARADVYATIKEVLDELPRAYDPEVYQRKVDAVYQHVFESYGGEGESVYSVA